MTGWKKHFTHVPKNERLEKALKAAREGGIGNDTALGGFGNKYSSYLPEVYAGQPNRTERYSQYDQMDQDSEIHGALSTIADFCTQTEEQNPLPFSFEFMEEATETEVEILKTALQQWVKNNDFNSRVWDVFRNTLKFGDQFFIRDPETFEWLWVDPANVEKIIVDEAKGKKPELYIMKGLDLNQQNKSASQAVTHDAANALALGPGAQAHGGVSQGIGGMGMPVTQSQFSLPTGTVGGRMKSETQFQVDARHVVHISLSNNNDGNWPFGNSILESIFKTYKQKELLEDSIIIYRVQRAPERRIFYIDVGNTPPTKAMAYVERVKNEIHQKRIPNRTGGGSSIIDAAYNPLTIIEDYFFATTAEGRGSKVETLPGGDNLGEIDDLKYFNNKLIRGLGVPSSYLPTGPEDGAHSWNDGRVGTAYIQEYRFGKYCERLQRLLIRVFDLEFKRFLEAKGLQIDPSVFVLEFNKPQNFSQYRQIESDGAQIGIFTQLAEIPYLSKRFLLKRFLDLSEDEIIENERMWSEENAERIEDETGINPHADAGDPVGMGAIGIGSGGEFASGEDLDAGFDEELGGEELGGAPGSASPISGDEGAEPEIEL